MTEQEKILQKISKGREYRSMTMEIREGEEDAGQIVEGYATTFDQPYVLYTTENKNGRKITVSEQVDRDAFKDADMTDVIMQYDHQGRVFARISNDTLSLEEDEHGLKIRADLGGTTLGRQLYEEIKGGYTNKMSFGFTVDADDIKADKDGNYLRTIRKIGKLFDVSAVSLPANDYTEISARNHCDGVIAEIEAERLLAEERKAAEEQKREALLARLNTLKGEEKHGD